VLRRHFELPGADADPVCYEVDLGPLRLVVLDSTLPGEDSGALDGAQLAWLDGVLAASPKQPTLIAMQGRLDFGARELRLAAEPPGFAVHAVLDGEVSSHLQPVA
jgi:hypothetical protein